VATLEQNRAHWARYRWPRDGDEWDDQAAFAGVPYPAWKQSLLATFLPVGPDDTVAEVGVGHGRWAAPLLGRCRYAGFDVVAECVRACQQKWPEHADAFQVCDGLSLPLGAGSVDWVWSFDCLVHCDEAVMGSYCRDFFRVLRPGGKAVVHHAGWPTDEQRAAGGRDGAAVVVGRLAREAGLVVEAQTDHWEGGNVKLFADCLSVLRRP
jgi:SAM-dependent methyltransferase